MFEPAVSDGDWIQILSNAQIWINHYITCTWRVKWLYTYVLLLVWSGGMLLRRWATGLTKGSGSWCWGAFSQLDFALLPVSLIPSPAACCACFCPVSPYQRMPPEHDNTKHLSLPCFGTFRRGLSAYLSWHHPWEIDLWHGDYSNMHSRLMRTDQNEAPKPTSYCRWPHFCQNLPPQTTYTHKSSTILKYM